MLEKKIEKARQNNSKLRWKKIIAFAIAIIVSILIFGSLQNNNLVLPKNKPVTAPETNKSSGTDLEKLRAEFKNLFKQYKNELEPRLLRINLKHWNKDALNTINEIENVMMLSFSKSDYQKALENIRQLTTNVMAILEESERIFRNNQEAAALFYSDDNYDKASLYIEKALIIFPHSVEALALKKDIEKLGHILPLLKKANAARAERDHINEFNILQKIIKLDSKRIKETARFNYLKQKIKDNSFDIQITSAFEKIGNNKITEAKSYYEKAKKVDPKRKELKILMSKISQSEKLYSIQESIRKADEAARQDNWLQAKINFAEVLRHMPENEKAVKGLKLSEEILEIQFILDQHINSPYRLTDKNILNNVKEILIQAERVTEHSTSIKSKIDKLKKLIDIFNRLIPVTIKSDNRTDIKVRSFGKLGVVLNKTIQLKPGNYIFEGTRKGFKSKLLQVTIPYNQKSYIISIICDEPI